MSKGAQQPNQSDNSLGMLWILAGIFVVGGGIWVYFRAQIVTFIFKIKFLEIYAVDIFTHRLEIVSQWMRTVDPATVTLSQLHDVNVAIGYYLRTPFTLLLLLLATALYMGNPAGRFKKTYSMKDFREAEAVNWPQINPVVDLDLVKEDIDKGPWSMGMTPMRFAKKHRLLDEHIKPIYEGQLRKEARTEVTVKRGGATRLFSLQLGPLWPGAHRLNAHTKALFAIFAARINNDDVGAGQLIKQINLSARETLDFSGVNALCRKYQNTEKVVKVLHTHAYVLTVMASMLEKARLTGVLATADFLWLKPIDRPLWYMLNGVGRQTPCVEVAGPFAHWLAEKEIERPLVVPIVTEASNALELAIKDVLYKAETED